LAAPAAGKTSRCRPSRRSRGTGSSDPPGPGSRCHSDPPTSDLLHRDESVVIQSHAFTSELKDFIAPIPINITNCAPVTLNNKAWAEADNFTPTGGNVGDSISDTGKIEVTEDTSASLDVRSTSVQYARKPEPMSTLG
jgi:hypothetical protein